MKPSFNRISKLLDTKINSYLTAFDVGWFFILFVGAMCFPSHGVKYIVGDNICQIGYWHTLLHPQLIGGIAASAAKPGLVILFGALYDVFHNVSSIQDLAFKLCFAFFFSLTVFMVGRIAADFGGKVAGIVASLLVVSKGILFYGLMRGSPEIISTGLLLSAIWLFSKNKYFWSFFILSIAISIRIENAGVSAVLLCVYLFCRKDWSKAILYTCLSTVFIAIYFYGNFLIQGSFARLDPLHTAGYFYPTSMSIIFNLCEAFKNSFFSTAGSWFLVIPAIAAVIFLKRSRLYLTLLGLLIIVIGYQIVFAGPICDRFIFPIIALIVALGIGYCFNLIKTEVTARHIRNLLIITTLSILFISLFVTVYMCYLYGQKFHYTFLYCIPLPLILILMKFFKFTSSAIRLSRVLVGAILISQLFIISRYSYLVYTKQWGLHYDNYITQGTNFIQDRPIPKDQKIISEDDILYVLATFDPDYYKGFFALQAFNVCDSNSRKGIIDKFDYIYFSKTAGHGYYYLIYMPIQSWNEDPFRKTVMSIIESNHPREIYGHTLTPIENSETRLILKIDPITNSKVL